MILSSLALTGISFFLAPQTTAAGPFVRHEKLLDTSFVDQKPPGYLKTNIQASLLPTVFPINEADVVAYDPATMTITLPITPTYTAGDVIVFGEPGKEAGVKIVSLTSSVYNTSTYVCEPPTLDDVLSPGDVSIGFTPDFSLAKQLGERKARFIPSTSSGLKVIDLSDTSLFDIKVKANGTIDLQSSSLMGEPLEDAPPGAIQQADTSQVAGGSFSAHIVTGTLELIPTMGIEKKGSVLAGTTTGTFEGIARLDLEVEMTATGKVTFSTAAKLFPDLSVTVLTPTVPPMPITGTLELPAGFDLDEKSRAQQRCITRQSTRMS